MAIAQRRLPWRLPTKWAWAMEKAGPSRKEVAELWRDPARFPVALSLVMLRLALWPDPARRFAGAVLVVVLGLGRWPGPARPIGGGVLGGVGGGGGHCCWCRCGGGSRRGRGGWWRRCR